jgi:hypothetical protein
MACSHVITDADNKIKAYEDEKEKYTSFIGEAESVKGGIESYSSFMSDLGGRLADVRPAGVSYDDGECAVYSSKLTSLAGDIGIMIGEAGRALTEIDEDIQKQKARKSGYEMCYSCIKAQEEAARKNSNSNS